MGVIKEEEIRNQNRTIIGYYQYMSNGDIVVKNFSRTILGYYKKDRDVTTDFYGRILAHGNVVGMLFGRG